MQYLKVFVFLNTLLQPSQSTKGNQYMSTNSVNQAINKPTQIKTFVQSNLGIDKLFPLKEQI